ncbi:hypothetical protein epsilon15_p11 [Salmonella phage epsilon15]|uniref:Uncharacterized protein n=1 Tax=Salmonella phage epsilon15 TaxID=215158 RepID=Q858E5_BPE15|nr:hypothetical protein epsilon15_p11 [Salmonella phage epsilon15]AAO06093.1 hypothetical protein [Salmonella phage epsilon15]
MTNPHDISESAASRWFIQLCAEDGLFLADRLFRTH